MIYFYFRLFWGVEFKFFRWYLFCVGVFFECGVFVFERKLIISVKSFVGVVRISWRVCGVEEEMNRFVDVVEVFYLWYFIRRGWEGFVVGVYL